MKEYWKCIIGPFERDNLPDGCDFPLRQAVKSEYERITNSIEYTCSSGWGVTEEMNDALFYASMYPKEVLQFIKTMKGRK